MLDLSENRLSRVGGDTLNFETGSRGLLRTRRTVAVGNTIISISHCHESPSTREGIGKLRVAKNDEVDDDLRMNQSRANFGRTRTM